MTGLYQLQMKGGVGIVSYQPLEAQAALTFEGANTMQHYLMVTPPDTVLCQAFLIGMGIAAPVISIHDFLVRP